MLNRFFIFLILAVALLSCGSESVPRDILSPTDLQPVMWDLMAAGEVKLSDTTQATRLHLKDSMTAELQYVLRIHHLDKQSFMKSYLYYENHPDLQAVLIDSLIAYNDRMEKKWNKVPATNPKKPKAPAPVPLPQKGILPR